MAIVQLLNVDGDPAGLYEFDDQQYPWQEACRKVEAALDLNRGEDSPQEAADELLENQGIRRVFASEATTDVI